MNPGSDFSDIDLGVTIRGLREGQKMFGRYTLRRVLGRGGMGVVWRAWDERLDREVALKFLPELLMHDLGALKDLKSETRQSLEMSHPHIVRVFDFVEDGQCACIAMEFIDGQTLSNLKAAKSARCYEIEEIRTWIGQLLDALAYAHETARVVHRDLKPANLMISSRGVLKVTDFGIARSITDSVSRLTAVSHRGSGGTLAYMSPQQALGENAAVADDIYAVGATIFDLVTGKPAFHSGEIFFQVRDKVPPSMTQRREEFGVNGEPITEEWERAVAACLSKQPEARPQSARELAALLGFAEPAKPHAPAAVTTRTAAAPAQRKRSSFGVLVAPLIACAAGAGWWFGFEQPRREREEVERARAAAVAAEAQREAEAASQKDRSLVIGEVVAGRTSLAQALWAEARSHFAKALEIDPANIEAKESLKRIDEHLAAARGEVSIATEPAGAMVEIGGKSIAAPATFRELPLGKQRLKITLDGYEPEEREVEIREGEPVALEAIALKRSTGTLRLSTTPDGTEFVVTDEKGAQVSTGRTPQTIRDLPTGKYEVAFRRAEWPLANRSVTIERSRAADVLADFTPGTLVVSAKPAGTEIFVKNAAGELVSKGRSEEGKPLRLELPPGAQEVVARYDGWPEQTGSATVTAKSETPLAFEFLFGSVRVTSQPAGAEILLKGRSLGVTPKTVQVPVGTQELTLRYKGWPEKTRSIAVTKERTADVSTTFQGATVSFSSQPPGATVSLDGKSYGTTPLEIENVRPGTNRFKIALEGYATQTVLIATTEGKRAEKMVQLEVPAPAAAPVPAAIPAPAGAERFTGTWSGQIEIKTGRNKSILKGYFSLNAKSGKVSGWGTMTEPMRFDGNTATWAWRTADGAVQQWHFELSEDGQNASAEVTISGSSSSSGSGDFTRQSSAPSTASRTTSQAPAAAHAPAAGVPPSADTAKFTGTWSGKIKTPDKKGRISRMSWKFDIDAARGLVRGQVDDDEYPAATAALHVLGNTISWQWSYLGQSQSWTLRMTDAESSEIEVSVQTPLGNSSSTFERD